MAFTGKLGTPDSYPANVQLGAVPPGAGVASADAAALAESAAVAAGVYLSGGVGPAVGLAASVGTAVGLTGST